MKSLIVERKVNCIQNLLMAVLIRNEYNGTF